MNLKLRLSVRNNLFDPPARQDYEVPDHLDMSFIEYALVKSFFVDITSQVTIKASLSKQFHLSPRDIDTMPYWEYEMWLKELNRLVEEENEQQQEGQSKYGNVDRYMKNFERTQRNMDRMANWQPNFDKMTSPNINIPNI